MTIDLTEDERRFLCTAIKGSTAPCDQAMEDRMLMRLQELREGSPDNERYRLRCALDALQAMVQQVMRGDASQHTANFFVAEAVLRSEGRRPAP